MGFWGINKSEVARAETKDEAPPPAIAFPDSRKLKTVTDKISSALKKELGGGVVINSQHGTGSGGNKVTTNVTINVMLFPEMPDALVEGFLDRIVEKKSREERELDDEELYGFRGGRYRR